MVEIAKSDRRVQYTKRVLQEAVLELMKTQSIDKLTIRDICELADVNRGTFYLHYATPNDILMEIEQQFIKDNMSFFSPYLSNTQETNQLERLFSGILQSKELSRVIMGPNGSPRFVERLKEMVREQVVNGWHAEFPEYRRDDLDYVYDYVFAGSMRIILNWIDDDRNLSTEQLANRLDRLGHFCHLSIAQFKR